MKKKENIILIGAGGHCVSCIDVIEQEGKYNIIGILDDDKVLLGKKVLGYNILGDSDDIKKYNVECPNFFITIGQIKTSSIRSSIFEKLKTFKIKIPSIISPLAYVSEYSELGEGTIIMHGAIVNANAKIGENCIINTNSLIEHDSDIGAHCHVSTGSIINGTVKVGAKSFIGSNATLTNNITIAEDVIVASGTTVFKKITRSGTYAGNPAKQIG